MLIEERLIQDIPVLLGCKQTGAPQPLIVLSHGFTRSREDWRERIPDLADRGCCVAALDNRGHGKSGGPDFQTRADRNGKWEILAIRQLIAETAEDIRTVIDGLLRTENVDGTRIGLAGVSMGAFAGLKATVMDSRIRVMVSNIGSPYWDDVFAGTLEEADPELRAQLAAYAARHEPAAFRDRFYPRAILFQTGGKDPHFDSGRVAAFAGQLRESYPSAPERVQCREYLGIGHQFTPAMWENTLGWFEKFL